MGTPLVSVLMTAYNREKYIDEAIESVQGSSYPNWELIVVDDCSKDRTVEIARTYAAKDDRIKVYVNEKNLGDYPNRNTAASLARGEFIKYVDSDDVMFPSCLKKMVAPMIQFPEAGYGICSVIDANTKICTSPRETYLEHFGRFGHFDRSPGGAIIKKSAFDRVSGFSGIRQVGDFEFWLKIGC
jgi:glycosyltransferase involved in cell wall biosynthesis